MKKTLIAAALGLAASIAFAQAPGYGPGYGPGAGYGPGNGPGMMGGYGPGYGAGYGPGMRGRGGYGGGMMGGYGSGSLAALELTSEQTEKVLAIQEENRSRNWSTMGEMRKEMFKLRQMYYSDKLDSNAYTDQQKKVDELRRQMLKSQLESRKQIEAVLTPEQRKQFRQFGPPWLEDDGG